MLIYDVCSVSYLCNFKSTADLGMLFNGDGDVGDTNDIFKLYLNSNWASKIS